MGKQLDNVNQGAAMPPSRPQADGDELVELLHTVTHRLRSQRHQALRDDPLPLTQMQSHVLGFVARLPGATQSDLVQHSGRDKAQLARLIKGLRERGLLAAQSDPADRRQLRLRLTREGQGVLRSFQRQTRRLGTQAVSGLSANERDQLRSLLQRLRDQLAGQR